MAKKKAKAAVRGRISPQLKPLAVDLETLRPDAHNVRRHPERNIEEIMAALKQYGQQKPVVVSAGGRVMAGNGVLLAARRLGWTHLAAVKTNLRGHRLRAYAIADNRTSDLSEFDEAALAEQAREIEAAGIDVLSLGFTAEEMAALGQDVEAAGEEDAPDETQEISHKTQQPGIAFVAGDYRFTIGRRRYARWLKELKATGGDDTRGAVTEIQRRLQL